MQRVITGLVLLLLVHAGQADPVLDSRLRLGTTELGKSLTLLLSTNKPDINLTSIDLAPLARDFHAELGDYSRDEVTQYLSLKLYPRHTGNLTVPSLSLGALETREHRATVLPATSAQRQLDVSLTLPPAEAVQRKAILVRWRVSTPDRYATIRMDEARIHGFELHPLPVERQWQPDADDGRGRLTIKGGWSLLPLSAGQLRVVLPALQYQHGGSVERRFHLPIHAITVIPLPPYVPPTMPVGTVQIESSISPAGLLYTDRLAYWQVTLRSDSLAPYWLPPVLQGLSSGNDAIEYFPPYSSRDMHPDHEGLNGRVVHRIPFKPRANGRIALPELSFQYYDPNTGRLERVVHEPARPWALGWLTRLLIGLVLMLLVLVTLVMLYRLLVRHLRRRALLDEAIQQITAACTPRDILVGLRACGVALGWPGNLTLTDWASHWQASLAYNSQLPELIDQLSRACYGARHEQNLDQMAASWLALIKSRQRRYRKSTDK